MSLINILSGLAKSNNAGTNAGTTSIPMLVMWGESNSGGRVDNALLTTTEKGVRPKTKILNNYTLVFQAMQIGVNDNLDHFGISDNAESSWENELGNMADGNELSTSMLHIVKTGQGGSKISQWVSGGTYDNKLNARLNAAISELSITATNNKFAMLASIGINDYINAGYNSTTFINSVVAFINRKRSEYGMFPVVFTQFMSSYPTLSADIITICNNLSNAYSITTSDLGLMDTNHWNYAGQKTIARRMINALQSNGFII